ncbi:MAG: 2,3-bisphosphoglycerate-independent phosphoglycerate mutase [Fibrobacterota bacterium]
MNKKPLCLIIMDGWGVAPADNRNALAKAHTPELDRLFEKYPSSELRAEGLNVGLPEGNQGNSEVGHLNLGAGRIVKQMLVRIDDDIESGEFFNNPVLRETVSYCLEKDSALHLMGLIQDQGVHAVTRHAAALLRLCAKEGLGKVFIHVISDGRDTPPRSAKEHITELEKAVKESGVGEIATLTGRYYAMDRDNNYDRVKIAYDTLTSPGENSFPGWREALEDAYGAGENDEFIKPRIVGSFSGIKDGDAVINFNFRLDRAREITHAFTDSDFSGFERKKIDLKYTAFTSYYDDGDFSVAFPPASQDNILGKVLADNGLKQLRCAETEKYAHVTFFFNDSDETPFEGEKRIVVPSPKVATYDMKPEMSAFEVRDKLLEAIDSEEHDVIIVNFANGDMVGHTGVFDAVVKAGEAVDKCVGEVTGSVLSKGGSVIITADHGNAECMMLDDGSPMTAHTTNPVPVIICGTEAAQIRSGGKLCDVAPTMCRILGIEIPEEMQGSPLF